MDIISKRRIWYRISLGVLVPGIIALAVFGLRLGIDFTGGAVLSVRSDAGRDAVARIIETEGFQDATVTSGEDNRFQVRYTGDNAAELEDALENQGLAVEQFDQVGPSVSRDLTRNAVISLVVVSLAIVVYVAVSFRRVAHPFRYGTIAIVALLHDGLFILGLFAVLGRFANVEVDAFIVTAVLTVIGFSVHDTIVVFDRIRENIGRLTGELKDIINTSVNEVFVRSLNTSITTILVLLALYLFGGASISNFVLALLLGMISGTYSSIFIAAPLLVTWNEYARKRTES